MIVLLPISIFLIVGSVYFAAFALPLWLFAKAWHRLSEGRFTKASIWGSIGLLLLCWELGVSTDAEVVFGTLVGAGLLADIYKFVRSLVEDAQMSKKLLLTGMLLALSAPAFAVEMPEAMRGDWAPKTGDDEALYRVEQGDFVIDKDKYYGVDTECTVLNVEKQAENLYTVQAKCVVIDQDPQPYTETNEFELLNKDKLLVTPAGS